jgi:hypothetical protein
MRKTISGIPAGSNLAKKAEKADRVASLLRWGFSGGGHEWQGTAEAVHDAIVAENHHRVE